MMGRAVTPAEYTADQKREAQAIAEVERTVTNIQNYKRALEESPEMEMRSILNALAGGYVAPTSGGDAVANPQAVPTGRNLYAVNAETTPSEQAWAKGKEPGREYACTIQENARRLSAQSQLHLLEQ